MEILRSEDSAANELSQYDTLATLKILINTWLQPGVRRGGRSQPFQRLSRNRRMEAVKTAAAPLAIQNTGLKPGVNESLQASSSRTTNPSAACSEPQNHMLFGPADSTAMTV